MDTLTVFSAEALIYIASFYAFYRIVTRHEKKHHIRHIFIVFFSAVSAYFASGFLKGLIQFPRPDLSQALFLPQDINSYGLPSGHAAYMFALAFAVYSFDKKAGIIVYAFAFATGIARALAGVHFWYDIVGGAVLGYFLAWAVVVLCKRLIRSY